MRDLRCAHPRTHTRLSVRGYRRPLDVADGVVIGVAAMGALWIAVHIAIGG